jgi:2-polyprenyl-6-methoxyphenol hydroxylase-like FAD-dependent oxidoreductase
VSGRTMSSQPVRSQVLVVGAGPVGLIAALRLREQGVDVRIIDQQSQHAAHSFPVVLHTTTLRLLASLGLIDVLVWRGRPVSHLAVYTEGERRAVLDLPKVADISPGALTLPQDVLREVLTRALSDRGVSIEWNTRIRALGQDEGGVRGELQEHFAGLPSFDQASAAARSHFEAEYVIGSDGYDSAVRDALGIRLVAHGALHSYAFFDAPTSRAGAEAQLAICEGSANAFYPLQGGLARFSFQLTGSLARAPDLSALRELTASRLPWHREDLESCAWGGVAEFRHALATHFGAGRVWLAGEAAHLTGPLGVQSLNVGLDEANELALRMADELRHPSRDGFAHDYDARRTQQWQELLGITERASLGARSPAWAWRNFNRILSCLPASGKDLDDLLEQLRLTPSSRPQVG